MAEDKAPIIPTLEDVVEIGTPEEENIQIVADNSSIDDAYDDEFNKLFDAPEETQSVAIDMDAVSDDTDDDELWDDSALQMVEDSPAPTPEQAQTADAELDGIEMTAEPSPVQLEPEAEQNADMWIQDWQEDIVESAVIDNMDSDLNITTDTASQPTNPDEETQSEQPTIIKAVQEDSDDSVDSTPAVIEQAPRTEAANTLPADAADAIPELVNEIVSAVLPEIEWKLRTRIRDILEQRLNPED